MQTWSWEVAEHVRLSRVFAQRVYTALGSYRMSQPWNICQLPAGNCLLNAAHPDILGCLEAVGDKDRPLWVCSDVVSW